MTDRERADEGATALAVDTGDCAHPTGDIRRLATNGLTSYYRCARCGGVVVTQTRH